jgi:glycosyltransferase involved in cell wall biosynthesis
MKFFIATPTWNSLDKLKRCIGSVRNELRTVDGTHFVQDGESSDGTPEFLAAQHDVQSRSEKDSGMYDAINRAWSRSDGDIVSWINSDEQYLAGTLERVRQEFERHPDADVITGDYIVVDAQGGAIAARRDIGIYMPLLAAGLMNVPTCATFFRRRLLDQGLLVLDSRYRYAADLALMLKLLEAGVRWRKIDGYLSLFAFDGSNLSCSPKMLKETDEIVASASGPRMPHVAARTARIVMRAARGCYMRANLSYCYTINEAGDTLPRSALRVPWTYRQR